MSILHAVECWLSINFILWLWFTRPLKSEGGGFRSSTHGELTK